MIFWKQCEIVGVPVEFSGCMCPELMISYNNGFILMLHDEEVNSCHLEIDKSLKVSKHIDKQWKGYGLPWQLIVSAISS